MSPPRSDLTDLLVNITAVLLDFDGPICTVYAQLTAAAIAAQLCDTLASHGVPIPTHLAQISDPLAILSFATTQPPDLARLVESQLRDAELQAVGTATPTPNVTEVIDACHHTNRKVAAVSNNSQQAVAAYLTQRSLIRRFDMVVGRTSDNLQYLKPHPHLVRTAAQELKIPPSACLLVGDSDSDIQAARAAGVASIGYANKPGKRARLAHAGAYTVIDNMNDLARALDRG
jgi:HAD superfamily hydrolase (TIGR01509 family)